MQVDLAATGEFAPPSIAVIITAFTFDRIDSIAEIVDSMRAQTVPPAEVLLVIDYQPELEAECARRWPDVRVIPNRQEHGSCGGRNTGVEESEGDVVAFLDDDAVPGQDWIERLGRAYEDPNVIAVGGGVRPRWMTSRPAWFPPEFDWVVGCMHSGMPHELAPVRNVIAANMSVRRADMIAVGGLRQEFSRIQKNAAGGEETDLCIRLRASRPGAVVLYDPDAGVEHLVPTERGELRYFIGRCFAEGRSKRTLAAMVGADDGLSSERSYVRRTLPLGVAANLGRLLRGDLAGAGRAGAIVLGLSTTVVGYLSVSAKADPAAPAAGDGRLRVLTATPRSPLVQGGVERHVMEVTRRVAAAGVDTEVLCTEPGGSAVREEERDGVKITTLPSYPADRDWCVSPRLWGEMKRRRGDVVHVQSYHTFVAPAAMLRALVLGIPYVVTFHGGGHSSGLRNRLRVSQRRVLRPLLARAAALVAVAKFEIDQYSRELRLPPERFTFIPNGTELAFSDRSAPIECNGAPVIATVGRLERYKGHHRVIAAFPELLALEPEATLLVVGSGPYEQELRRLAAAAEPNGGERIKFTSVPADRPEEMAKLMRGVSVMVLMSEFETHPLVALEGAAAGCRLLVAGVGGLGELAEDGLARAVPLEEDPAGLARAIAEELELPPPTEVPKLASWDDCAAALLDLYREIAVPQQTSKSA